MTLDLGRELNCLFSDSGKAESLFKQLKSADELYLFGGAVRDFIEKKEGGKTNYLPRDFDFVIRTKQKGFIEKIINGCKYKRNNFGGYKVFLDSYIFDIWEMKNTWAFKKKLVKESSEKLYKTVFLDVDAIVYDVHKNIIINNQYSKAKEKKEIDIVLKKNPCVKLNLLRALYFKRRYKLEFSRKLNEVFINAMLNDENIYNEIYKSQLNHYKPCKLSVEEIKDELEMLKQIIVNHQKCH